MLKRQFFLLILSTSKGNYYPFPQFYTKRVKNIKEVCNIDLDKDQFFDKLVDHFSSIYKSIEFSDSQIQMIKSIADAKYATYEWNVGESPKAEFTKKVKFDYGIVELSFDIIDGVLANTRLLGDYFELKNTAEIEAKLNGVRPNRGALSNALIDIGDYIRGAEVGQFIDKIFFDGE